MHFDALWIDLMHCGAFRCIVVHFDALLCIVVHCDALLCILEHIDALLLMYCRLLEFMYDVISKEHLESVVSLLPKKHATLVTQATKDARELTAAHISNEVCIRMVCF